MIFSCCRSQTAWPGPAKWDAYAANEGLQSMRNFDPAFYVTIANGSVYFGSSVDHAAHCLDATSGKERWVHFTNSPVRLPPTIHGGRAYFGSDDGHAYCVRADSGKRIWKVKPAPDPRLIPSNGKLISPWPVRSGVMVANGTAYFAASLVPWEVSYLCAVDAETGSTGAEGHFIKEEKGVTFQGSLLASKDRIYAPQGRSVPLVFNATNGRRSGSIGGSGGVYCVLTEDDQFIAMPENQKSKEDTIRIVDGTKKQTLLTIAGANRMIASGRHAYFHRGNTIQVIDRTRMTEIQARINGLRAKNKQLSGNVKFAKTEIAKRTKRLENKPSGKDSPPPPPLPVEESEKLRREIESFQSQLAETTAKMKDNDGAIRTLESSKEECEIWKKNHSIPIGFMLAGDTLFVGGVGVITAFDARNGTERWTAKVDGKAYGLAAADGRLFVSTDRGCIYCFAR